MEPLSRRLWDFFRASAALPRRTTGHKNYWRENLVRERADYELMVSAGPFEGWESNRAPESTAEFEFVVGLQIAFAEPDSKLARQFFSKAVAVVDRAFAEEKFDDDLCRGGFPGNVAIAYRTKACCVSIITGTTQEPLYREAAKYFLRNCEHQPDWTHPIDQNYYLTGIRTALLAGDHELAQEIYRAGRAPDHTHEPHLLRALITAARTGERLPQKLQEELETLFETTRHPRYDHDPPLLVTRAPFEIACLREKYVISEDRRINWIRVLEDFSR